MATVITFILQDIPNNNDVLSDDNNNELKVNDDDKSLNNRADI